MRPEAPDAAGPQGVASSPAGRPSVAGRSPGPPSLPAVRALLVVVGSLAVLALVAGIGVAWVLQAANRAAIRRAQQ